MERQNGWLGKARRAGDWARRMLFGERIGDGLVVLDESTDPVRRRGPVVAVVFGQYPNELPADALLEGPIPPGRIREVVGRIGACVQTAPDWWLHGLHELPWDVDRTGRWVVEVAREVGEGRIVADLREAPPDLGRRLAAQLERWRRLRGTGGGGPATSPGG